ncbi:MAG TPA: bifunctional shikimate kinase/3-dehydroquinate synthase [Solirubrobacterales bacterium]|nr:bifunctional shikimate kinase/3-dehydroquinate synthase [Solirubrobacterales bacterium]
MKPSIVFVGFMGAGKSTALAAARAEGLPTTEIDELMERSFGSTIPQAFERHGEEGFREREAEVVGSLLERADDGGAIALGGGSVLSPRIRAAMARHTVVWLQVDATEAWRRIAHSDRPLASSAESVGTLLATRLPLYEELADAVVPMGDRQIVRRALPTIRRLAAMPAGTKLLWASAPGGEYPVLVGHGILDAGWWPLESRRFLVTDRSVGPLYAERLEPLAGTAEIEAGETAKTLANTEKVLRAMARDGATRSDHVVALGGGVVGDLAGLVAHLYQRGVPVVQVPTTLVSQVDSAYGGKVGVDLPEGKNYAGAFQQPAAVIADVDSLRTLPSDELAAGFVEVLKTGLLAGGSLWERVRAIKELDPGGLDDVIFACARYKCQVVAADELDTGLRNVLNLGHTVGHAIESATGYTAYRHGEAVGLGLLAALRLADASDLRDEVEAILATHNLPTHLEVPLAVEDIVEALGRDKKRTAAGVGFVLLARPGEPRIGQLVDPAKVEAAVKELMNQ